MKILTVSDEECAALWDRYVPGRLNDYDLIISCGDLKAEYLSFLVTMAKCPVLYVPGNHDTGYLKKPPEGCDCIDDHFVIYNGLRILGLGGCKKYNNGPHHYTEAQMRRRIRRLRFQLWLHKGVDIVVTHAAPAGLGDAEDPAHQGFDALTDLVDKYQPAYLIHGHVHISYDRSIPREIQRGNTKIINAYERWTLEIPDRDVPPGQYGQVIYTTPRKHAGYWDEEY